MYIWCLYPYTQNIFSVNRFLRMFNSSCPSDSKMSPMYPYTVFPLSSSYWSTTIDTPIPCQVHVTPERYSLLHAVRPTCSDRHDPGGDVCYISEIVVGIRSKMDCCGSAKIIVFFCSDFCLAKKKLFISFWQILFRKTDLFSPRFRTNFLVFFSNALRFSSGCRLLDPLKIRPRIFTNEHILTFRKFLRPDFKCWDFPPSPHCIFKPSCRVSSIPDVFTTNEADARVKAVTENYLLKSSRSHV